MKATTKSTATKSIKTIICQMILGMSLFAAIFLAGAAFPKMVQAAVPYESHTFYYYGDTSQYRIGGKYFWFDRSLKVSSSLSGKRTTLYTPKPGETLQGGVSSNGDYALHAVEKKGSTKVTVYITNLKTNRQKAYCTYKASYGAFAGYYNGKIYMKKMLPEPYDAWSVSTYDKSSRKYKTILKEVGYFQQYGQYFGWSYPQCDPGPRTLSVYNSRTGKNQLIARFANTRSIVNGTMYYMEWSSGIGTTGVLKSCKLDGSGKKTIASFRNTMPGALLAVYGPKYAVVRNRETYYRVYYQNGRKKASNWDEFLNIARNY